MEEEPIPEISPEEQILINETLLEACHANAIYTIRLLISRSTNIQECAEEAVCCDHTDIFQEIINNDPNEDINYDVCSMTAVEHGCLNSLNMILSSITNYNECLLLAISKGTTLNDRIYLDIGELLLPYSSFDTSILDGLRNKYN